MDSVDVVFERPGGREAIPLQQISQVVRGIATDFAKVTKRIRVFVEPSIRARLDDKMMVLQRELLDEILS